MRTVASVKTVARLLYDNSLVGYRIYYLGETYDIDNEHYDWFMYDAYREQELIEQQIPVLELVKVGGRLAVVGDEEDYPEITYNDLALKTKLINAKTDYNLRQTYVKYNNQYFGGRLIRNVSVSWCGRLLRAGGTCATYQIKNLFDGKYIPSATIKLSKKHLLNENRDKAVIKNVFLHEMIHVEFPSDGHGNLFLGRVKSLKEDFNLDIPLTLNYVEFNDDQYSQILQCSECDKIYKLTRKKKNVNQYRCGVKTCKAPLVDITDYV